MKRALLALAVTSLLALTPPAMAMAERSELGELQLTEVADGLEHPWALAFLPEGQGYLISERPGRLRLLDAQGRLHPPLGGVPAVFARGQGGLLDIALSPGFATDRLVYLSYAEADDEGQRAGTAVGRGRLKEDLSALEGFRVIFRQLPKLSEGIHFGSRMAFGADGQLYVSLGENNQRATAQQLDKLQGKLVRLQPGGGVPADNPFLGREGVRPEIWSYGHRNPQGLALNPWSGRLWLHEHGPRGGDEINIPKAGRNYGWPKATHGINYSFLPIPEAEGATVAGTEPPHHVWEKSPAISGMAFYSAERFPAWQHSLFIGALAGQALIRLQLQGDQVVHEERLLQDRGWRIRDVRQGPDGFLYLLTDAPDGKLVRLGLATGR
jgi:glucose/arabinose dehydrogenase